MGLYLNQEQISVTWAGKLVYLWIFLSPLADICSYFNKFLWKQDFLSYVILLIKLIYLYLKVFRHLQWKITQNTKKHSFLFAVWSEGTVKYISIFKQFLCFFMLLAKLVVCSLGIQRTYLYNLLPSICPSLCLKVVNIWLYKTCEKLK